MCKYTPYGNVQKEKILTKNEIKHQNYTEQHTVRSDDIGCDAVQTMLLLCVCDRCSVFLYDMRLNQLVAKVFNGDVAEGDNRPVSESHTCWLIDCNDVLYTRQNLAMFHCYNVLLVCH